MARAPIPIALNDNFAWKWLLRLDCSPLQGDTT